MIKIKNSLLHLSPSPKYPALQEQVELSVKDPDTHPFCSMALLSQALQEL
jgi:hypothetical protein